MRTMTKVTTTACLAALAALLVCAGCGSDEGPETLMFVESEIWDDGQAEVTTYDATRIVDGEARAYTQTDIVVKEDLDAETLVKAGSIDVERVVLPVFKFAQIATIPAPAYSYHYLATAFVVRQFPRQLVKLTVGSQEWDGNTFQEVTVGENPAYRYHSYFDGLAEGSVDLDVQEGDLFEDTLPVALRSMAFSEHMTFAARVWPSFINNKPIDPAPLQAQFAVSPEKVEVPAGKFKTWRVTATSDAGVSSFWFDREKNGVLLKAEYADGRTLAMTGTERNQYWLVGKPEKADEAAAVEAEPETEAEETETEAADADDAEAEETEPADEPQAEDEPESAEAVEAVAVVESEGEGEGESEAAPVDEAAAPVEGGQPEAGDAETEVVETEAEVEVEAVPEDAAAQDDVPADDAADDSGCCG